MFKIQKVKKSKKTKVGKIKSYYRKMIALLLIYKGRFYQLVSLISKYKILAVIFLFVGTMSIVLMISRNNFISQVKNTQTIAFSSPPVISTTLPSPEIVSSSKYGPNLDVLGISIDKTTYNPPPVYIPKPIPTPTYSPIPIPTTTPTPVAFTFSTNTSVTTTSSNSSGGKNCVTLKTSPGVATAWYSQASTPQTVESTATITLELRDCNNNFAPVSDTLTISQSAGPSTTVNGSKPPISIEAVGGKASFTVKSQTSGTAVYIVRNTTKSFNVTDPNNKHPQVTFTISQPAPTSVPNTTPSPSPSASVSPVLASPSPSPTDAVLPTESPSSSPLSSP